MKEVKENPISVTEENPISVTEVTLNLCLIICVLS